MNTFKRIMRQKSTWAGMAAIATGIGMIVGGDMQTGIQTIVGGFGIIFIREAIASK